MLAPFLTTNGLVCLAFGYLLGSIPFGLLLTRAAGLGDVRKIGSGNIGATNVLRTGNKKLAAATLFLDGFKGYAAVALVLFFVAHWLLGVPAGAITGPKIEAGDPVAIGYLRSIYPLGIAAGLGAFLGHIFPVWLGFKGGKGVATYIGVLLGLAWIVGLIFCAIWAIMAVIFRYSSLAALTASSITPLIFIYHGNMRLAVFFMVLTLLLFWKHRENIARLTSGTEGKIGAKSGVPETDA